mmetsp:Transcript_28118/g.56515  ORF Transcript_28118/g.56515 Transcript_28118/m.56515 type:complete len:207 (+) Transcript_28118:345-965(+)
MTVHEEKGSKKYRYECSVEECKNQVIRRGFSNIKAIQTKTTGLEYVRGKVEQQSQSIDWNFGYTEYEEDWKRQYLLRDSYYNIDGGYDPDSSYGAIECVPKDGCDLSFNMTLRSPVESFTLKKNGIQLDDRQEIDAGYWAQMMTPFGQNCSPPSKSLSGGAIAGIVIACLLSVAAVGAIGLAWYKRRQSQSSKEEGEEDPMRESLL